MAARTEIPDDAATRQESTYETSCAETDDLSLADTDQPDYDVNAAWDIDKILAQAEFEDDSDGEPITDDAGEPSTVTKYLVKWTGYSLKSATWQDEEAFVDGAKKILWAWHDQHMNEKRGHKEAFDIGRWEDWCNKIDDVRDERHAKRNKKRKKLGLDVVVYATDEADADDEEEEDSRDVGARTRQKAGKGKGRAEANGDELGSGDMDISSSAADDDPLASRSRAVKVASVRTTKRLPFTDSDVDDNDKKQSDGDDVIMTGSTRTKRRRTAVAMEKEREQTRELMMRKKGRAVPVTQGSRTGIARNEDPPKPNTKSVVVAKAKDIAPSGYFASLKARTTPIARPTASTTDAASQSASAAPTARMVGGPGQAKPKGRTSTAATTSTTNIFLPSVAKAPAKAGETTKRIKTLSHMHNIMRKQRNEGAPDMSALTLFTPGTAVATTSSELYTPSKTTEKVTTLERRVSFATTPVRKDVQTSENASAATTTPATGELDEAWCGMASSLRVSEANTTPVVRRQPDEARSDLTTGSRSAASTTSPVAARQADETRSNILSPTLLSMSGSLANDTRQSQYPLYTCQQWARGSDCRWGRDCAFEHYNTGHLLSNGNNHIPHTEVTCAFWAGGGCVKPANQCKFVHGETRYLASNSGHLPSRLYPNDISERARHDLRKREQDDISRRRSERDEMQTRRQEQDAALKRQQDQDMALKRQQEQAAALQRQQEQDAALQRKQEQDVALRRQQEQDTASKRQQEQEAALRRQQQQESALQRKQEQDDVFKRGQEQDVIPKKKGDLTCWHWLFQTPQCRFPSKVCRFAHAEKKYVAPNYTGGTPISYKQAMEQLRGWAISDEYFSRVHMTDGGAEAHEDEALSMPYSTSLPHEPRALRDTGIDNLRDNVLPDVSVRRGTQSTADDNLKTMSSTQYSSINTSTTLRKSRTDLIPAVLVVNPTGQAPFPIDVDLEVLQFGAQKELFNVPSPGVVEAQPRVIRIDHICAAEFARTNFDFSLKQILAKGNILTSKANKRTVANFCETLDLNSSGAVMQHDHFAMFVVPARREAWKFLGLQSPSADVQLQFVATATFRPSVAAVTVPSPVATAPMQLPAATALVQSPLTASSILQATSRIAKFDAHKLFDKNGEKHAFLLVNQEYPRDIEILTAGLHAIGATVYLLTEPGAWSNFCSLSSGGAVIVHPAYDTYYEIPDLAGVLKQQISIRFFGFDSTNHSHPLSPLFPHGRAVFVMDSLWEDHVEDALVLLKQLKNRLTEHPENNRLVGRPDLVGWLYKLAMEEADAALSKQRQELWVQVYSHLYAKPEYLGRWPEDDGPTSSSPVYFAPGDLYVDYADLYVNDPGKAEDTMAEWFCLWSLANVDRFRNFIIVSAGAQRQKTKWLNQFKHIDVQTTTKYVELETAKADYERKRREEYDRKKRAGMKEKERERAKAM